MQLRLARDDTGAPEIFRSLQGEGPMAGRVRTFVRLSGCNLRCVWCDTAYTWNWRGSDFAHERGVKFDPAAEMMKVEIGEVVERVRALPAEGLVITGGEPFMQAEAVGALVRALRAAPPHLSIEVETNGAIAPGELADAFDLIVVSPKLAHSGNERALAVKHDALRAFASRPNTVFKFVARTEGDVAEAAEIAKEVGMPANAVMIMPEGTDSETLRARAAALAPAILAHGLAYSDRLHVHLFGARRGV